MANKRTNGRRCKFESLETRRLAAGNIIARVTNGGTAIITGDNFSNGVVITPGTNPFEIKVAGAVAGQLGTTINGAVGPFTLVNVINGLKVNMGIGNNIVTLQNLTINGKTAVKTGNGVDNVQILTSTFNSSLKVNTSKSADTLNVMTTTSLGKTSVKTDGSHDSVTFNGATLGALSVSLGKGNDTLKMLNSVVNTKTVLNGGQGINLPTINTGNFLGGSILKKNFAG